MKHSEIYDMYFYGKAEDSVFTKPFFSALEKLDTVSNLFKKSSKAGDERSLVLVSALSAEYCLDCLLNELLPGYDKLEENDNFTFSTKIKLLASFCLIPPHITLASDLVRKVRNQFAHNLEIEKIEDIRKTKPKIIDQLKGLYIERKIRTDRGVEDTRNVFDIIVYISTVVLLSYQANVKAYNRESRKRQFIANIGEINEQQRKTYIEALRQLTEGTKI